MGARFSKNGEGSSHRLHSPHQTRSHSVGAPTDLSSSYEAACRADPTLNSFDTTLHERTSRLINNLAAGVQVHSLSFDSLQDVTESLLDMNQDVVKIILESKKDIWKNPDLFDLVNEYLNSSLHTLDFCTDLDRCLKRARDRQAMVQAALERFEEEQKQGNGEEMGTAYTKTLQELKNFKAAGDPFTEEFFSLFQSVYRQQVAVFGKLQMKKRKLDKKLNNVKAWRKVSNILFVATFAAVVICSVVAAAVAAPPVVTALAAAASVPLGTMGKWFNSLWKKYENELKEQGALIGTMELGTYFAIKDLDTVRILVDKFEIEMDSMLKTAEFALRQDEALLLIVDEIKKKLSGFIKVIEDLSDHADKCSRDIRRARTVILHRIIKYPSSTN